MLLVLLHKVGMHMRGPPMYQTCQLHRQGLVNSTPDADTDVPQSSRRMLCQDFTKLLKGPCCKYVLQVTSITHTHQRTTDNALHDTIQSKPTR